MSSQWSQTRHTVLHMLKNTYLFNIFIESELESIIDYCEEEKFQEGETIFEEGDRPQKFYILIAGEVSIFQTIPGKKTFELARLQEGDFFGEMSLLDGFPRSATTKSIKDTVLLSMSFERFDELMNQNKDVGLKWLWTFCRVLSSRLRDTNEKYKMLMAK